MWFHAAYFKKINITLRSLIDADFCAAAVLISFGGLLGKINWAQLFVFATLEVFFYSLNFAITFVAIKYVDLGGSVNIHTFGAFFGLAATWWFKPKVAIEDKNK